MRAAHKNQKLVKSASVNESLAVLISNTLSKKRPVSLVEIATHLKMAIEQLGSVNAVADRIGITSKMLRQFLSVDKLTPEARKYFASRELDSVDMATHLAALSEKDQISLVGSINKLKLNTGDIRAIVDVKRLYPEEPIESAIQRILNSKTKIEYVVEFAIKGKATQSELEVLFKKYFSDKEMYRLEIVGSLGRLVLTQTGKRKLSLIAKEFGIPVKLTVSQILKLRP